MTDNELGAFLRARRARVDPSAAGLPTSGPRRVAGLRREEIAVLAGVSADYYTRLEQGRERHPSAQVLDALSRALDLDTDARAHLFRLANVMPDARVARAPEAVSPALLRLMDNFTATPALVMNRTLDVLATNALADALFSPFADASNLLVMTFVAPEGRTFYRDWHRAAQGAVAHLRESAGHDPHDPRLHELLDQVRDEEFTRLWEAHDIRGKTQDAKDLLHPDVGPLTLTYQAFDVRGAAGQQLIVYHAEPGSRSAEALALLGTLAATRRAEI